MLFLFANNQVYYVRTKHIGVGFHKIEELFVYVHILLENVHTSENIVDMMIKPIISDKLKNYWNLLHISQC